MRKCWTLIVAAALLLGLAGCQLAKPEAGTENAVDDKLVGVYVTAEYLDLFDFGAYLEDNAGQLLNGGGVTVSEQDAAAYGGRLYAEESGNRIRFPGVEGLGIYCYEAENEAGERSGFSYADDGFADVSYRAGQTTGLSATLYVPEKPGENVEFYCNAVYQSADGSIYLTSGQGMSSALSGGASMTHRIETKQTLREGDAEQTERTEIEITFQAVSPAEALTLVQLDAAHQVLDSERFAADELPTDITPEPGTAYIVVEILDAAGEIQRSLYAPESDGDVVELFLAGEESYCMPTYVALNWPEV